MASTAPNYLIYLIRHDLRYSDNPIFHRLASNQDHEFTHLLPVYVFPAQRCELSGFIKDGSPSPYPEAKSHVSKVWRTGPHRLKFIAQCVWDLKKTLESARSGLLIRVGNPSDVVSDLMDGLSLEQAKVGGVWLTHEEGAEEHREQQVILRLCRDKGAVLTKFQDEKYLVDDRDVTTPIGQIPDVFGTYHTSIGSLRTKPRAALPKPGTGGTGRLPLFPNQSQIPPQRSPFVIPTAYDELEEALLSPVRDFFPGIPPFPEGTESAHPFSGGETLAHERLRYWIKESLMQNYESTRNRLLGAAFSTKLSAFLSQGCITARQIHHELVKYEDGTDPEYQHAVGYNKGENPDTRMVRKELLWRDYMRLCTKKYGNQLLFNVHGFQGRRATNATTTASGQRKWKTFVQECARPDQTPSPAEIAFIVERFKAGTTGLGLIDASQRELLHTGYTSNRARQNVAYFLSRRLDIDWRIGAEWYECLLVDYDMSSNWGNWQYLAGVGNDPRGKDRSFNPVMQAFQYDKQGEYIKAWVPELRPLEDLLNVFQVTTTSPERLAQAGLVDNIMATNPVEKIEFSVEGKPKNPRGKKGSNSGRARGNGNGAPGGPAAPGGSRGAPSRGGRGGSFPGPRRGVGGSSGGGGYNNINNNINNNNNDNNNNNNHSSRSNSNSNNGRRRGFGRPVHQYDNAPNFYPRHPRQQQQQQPHILMAFAPGPASYGIVGMIPPPLQSVYNYARSPYSSVPPRRQ